MPKKNDHEAVSKSVRDRRERQERRAREGEGSIARDLAWMGGIAWLIVVPLLLGAFLGRMLDRTFGTGVTITAALILLGAFLGGYLAWRRIQGD